MIRPAVLCCAVALLALLCGPRESTADLDPLELRLRKAVDPLLFWDNVEGAPEWLQGPRPTRRPGRALHTVRLDPGETVRVRLPERAMLRVLVSDGGAVEDLRVGLSNGSGLWSEPRPAGRAPDGSRVWTPGAPHPVLWEVTCREEAEGPLEAALFVSRREPPEDMAPYRDLVPLSAPRVRIREPRSGDVWWAHRLEARQPVSVVVRGPARLLLETRCFYEPSDRDRVRRYRVSCRVEGLEEAALPFEVVPVFHRPLRVDGRVSTVGRVQRGFLEVPSGAHTLELETSVPVLARLLRLEIPGFLFPAWNGPDPNAASLRPGIPQEALNARPWALPESRWRRWLESADPALVARAAERLVRDNAHSGGGLLAAARLREIARDRPGDPELGNLAERMEGRHTGFRSLLPETGGGPAFLWYSHPRLRRLSGPEDRTADARQREGFLGTLSGGLFAVASREAGPRVYPVPPRPAPTTLRLAVPLADAPVRLLLRVGEEDPIPVRILRKPGLPRTAFVPGPAEAGLALLRRSAPGWEGTTLGGPFAAGRHAAPVVEAGTLEVPLPPEADRVTVRVEGPGEAFARVCLQVREANPYVLSREEEGWIRGVLNESQRFDLFAASLQPSLRGRVGPAKGPDAVEARLALQNAWVPLLRFLRSREAHFTASVSARPGGLLSKPDCPPGDRSVAMRMKEARGLESEGFQLAALEAWAEAAARSRGEARQACLLAVADGLLELGEDYLADHLLRGLYLHPPEGAASVSSEAFERLKRLAEKDPDPDRLLTLRSVQALAHPTTGVAARLAWSLLDGEYPELGALAARAIPSGERPWKVLVRAGLQSGRLDEVEEAADRLADGSRDLWTGLLRLRLGDLDGARSALSAAGERGTEWLAFLEAASGIRKRLASEDSSERLRAVSDWEAWQADHPGPSVWNAEPWLVREHAGAASVYSTSRDLRFRAFVARPGRPVRVKAWGPASLRFEVRPLHASGEAEPRSGWILLRREGATEPVPFTDNRPSPGLVLDGRTERPGAEERCHVVLESGPGEVRVAPKSGSALVRVLVERPEVRTSLLPLPSEWTVSAALERGFGSGSKPFYEGPCFWEDRFTILPAQPGAPPERIRLSTALTLAEQAGRAPDPQALELLPKQRREPKDRPLSEVLEVKRRVARWLWLAEEDPSLGLKAEIEVRALHRAHPEVPEVGEVLARIGRIGHIGWEEVSHIRESAGVRMVKVPSWLSETPMLRVRKALLGPKAPGEEILSGGGRMALSVRNVRPTTLRVEARIAELPYLEPQPMTVSCSLDGRPLQTTRFDAVEHPACELALDLPAGRHTVRFEIRSRYVNQFLRMRVLRPEDGCTVEARENRETRTYFLATQDVPVHAMVEGPTWVRIDEWRNGRVLTRYHRAAEGVNEMVLPPPHGRPEALYRVFRRTQRSGEAPERPELRPFEPSLPELPGPHLRLVERFREGLRVEDGLPLGTQEDGTWSVELRGDRRRSLEEDELSGDEPERFLELSATHRAFHEHLSAYTRGRLLGRARERGGPTLGLDGDVWFRPREIPWRFHVQGSLYAQDPASEDLQVFGSGPTEWSLRAEAEASRRWALGPKTAHTASVSLFGRLLSLDENPYEEAARLDQDVFTVYKADHRAGVRLEETLLHSPWLDTLWLAGVALGTNEDLNPLDPDHVRFRMGWRQLLGPFEAAATYRLTHYFEDRDRLEAVTRQYLDLDLSWDHWTLDQERLRIGGRLTRALDRDAFSAGVFMTWTFSTGRALRDFSPAEELFRHLKERRIPRARNNRVHSQ